MFASPKPQNIKKSGVLGASAVDNFIQISHKAKLESLVVSGGGEPMLELPSVLKLIREAHFKYFEITTGASWVINESVIRKTLNMIQQAINDRKKKRNDFKFCFRISIDKYHQKIIKIEWLKKLVEIIRKDAVLPNNQKLYPDINIFFRALLIRDNTVKQFASLLGAQLSDMNNYVRELKFNDGLSVGIKNIPVFYKDMRFVGRGKNINIATLVPFEHYFESYSDQNQDIRLGMTYISPASKGEVLSGINVFITYDGKMMLYGGSPDISVNIYFEGYQKFLSKLFRDIISRTLLLKGVNHIKEVAEEIDPGIERRVKRKNWIASVVDESLSTTEIRLYVTIRLLQKAIASGELDLKGVSISIQRLLLISPQTLQTEYQKYMHSIKYIHHTYGNEYIEIIEKRK